MIDIVDTIMQGKNWAYTRDIQVNRLRGKWPTAYQTQSFSEEETRDRFPISASNNVNESSLM